MLLYFVVARCFQKTLDDSTNTYVVLLNFPFTTLVTCNCASLPAGGSNEFTLPYCSLKMLPFTGCSPVTLIEGGVQEHNYVMEID